jgi:uncharacterized membrane protein
MVGFADAQSSHSFTFIVRILMRWRSRLQMVEQFEERVDDRLDEMEAKLLAAAESATQAAQVSQAVEKENERISTVTKQVPAMASPSCIQY